MMQSSRRLTGLVLCALAVSFYAIADEPTTTAEEAKPQVAKVGETAPDFTLKDINGQEHKLADLQDKTVVLEWLNQECPYSVRALPIVRKLHDEFTARGVVWLGVESTHWRKAEENQRYAKDQKLAYSILMDNDGRVGRLYGAKTTPHIFVIHQGKLVYAGALHDDARGKKPESEVRNYLKEALAAILDGKPVPLAETTPWGCSVKYAAAGKTR